MITRLKTYLKSTFVRYILSYLLLMALLVGGLTVYMYSYYRSNVYESTAAEETLRTWQLKYRADGSMLSLGNLAHLVERTEIDPNELIREFSYEEGDIFIYISAENKVYNAGGSQDAPDWLSSFDFENLTADELEGELFVPEGLAIITAQQVTSGEESKRLLTFAMPAGDKGSVIWMLDESTLLSLETDSSRSGNRYIIQNSEIRARSETLSVSESKVLEAGAFVPEAISEVKTLSGVNYLFTAVPGEISDMVFVSVQSLSGIRVKAAGIWLGFMLVLLALAVPTTLFMVYISRKNLAPILEMGRHFGKKGEKYSDDINAIVTGIRNLENKNREMETGSLAARRHLYARDLVTGAFEDDESARKAARELGYDINRRCYAILLVGEDRERTGQHFLDSLIDMADPDICCMGTELMESGQCMLICFSDDETAPERLADKLMNDERVSEMHLPVAISAAHTELKEMSGAYLEAGSAYESRFFMGVNRPLRFSEIPFATGENVKNAEDYAEQIRQALISGDMDAVDKCLEKLKSALRSENMNLFSFRRVYNDLIGAIMSQADVRHYSNAEIYDLFSLSSCHSVEELEQILRAVCENIISTRDPDERLPLIQKVTRIMSVNYTDSDFTLSRAAELAGITPARLTGEFKTKMGMTPMDYLTMLRMEEAKRLLRQTDLSVSDVCRQSGYADASSFTRRFKQYANVTPLQYRQSARADAAGGERSGK